MKVTIEPTEELTTVNAFGVETPCRVWRGQTDKGTPIEVFVVSITPASHEQNEAFLAEIPPFMIKTIALVATRVEPEKE